MAKQIGYAVVGAGPFVERALLPAFARAGGETRLAAIVSADRTRAHALAREHRATGYHYDEFRQALQREDVQAVYLALPNSLHCDYRNHRRILVVDGRVGFTGGSGVSGKWMGNGRVEHHWRDTDIRIQGPAVEYLQAAFVESWLEATGVVLGGEPYFPRPIERSGEVYAQVVKSSPAAGSFAMYTTFLLAVNSAQRSIHITNPYFVIDERMRDALLAARRRGVRVLVLVPGAIDHNIVRQASRRQFGSLLRAGVKIYEYVPALLHSKTMVIDGIWATIGSTNLDNRSFAVNDELNVIVYNRGVAQRLESVFSDDIAHSRRVTLKEWKSRGLTARLLETLALPIRDLL